MNGLIVCWWTSRLRCTKPESATLSAIKTDSGYQASIVSAGTARAQWAVARFEDRFMTGHRLDEIVQVVTRTGYSTSILPPIFILHIDCEVSAVKYRENNKSTDNFGFDSEAIARKNGKSSLETFAGDFPKGHR
jgi:hypothetical protein